MALRLPKQDYQDIERIMEFDFVRATEAAALNSLRWLGRGDKEAADAAPCDAMRGMFDPLWNDPRFQKLVSGPRTEDRL